MTVKNKAITATPLYESKGGNVSVPLIINSQHDLNSVYNQNSKTLLHHLMMIFEDNVP